MSGVFLFYFLKLTQDNSTSLSLSFCLYFSFLQERFCPDSTTLFKWIQNQSLLGIGLFNFDKQWELYADPLGQGLEGATITKLF